MNGVTPLAVGSGNVAMCLLRARASCKGLSNWQMQEMLHLACKVGDMLAARTLLENGCSVNSLSGAEQEKLLRRVYCEADMFVARILLRSGCSVNSLSREEQRELLNCAYCEGDIFVAITLLENGCGVNSLSTEDKKELLHCAYHEGDMLAVCTLVKNDCDVNSLSQEEQKELLHCACHEDDIFVARALLQNGCNVNSLSQEEQKELLHCACREGDIFVARALLQNGCNVNSLSQEEQKELLHCACREGDIFVVMTLLQNGCSVNSLSKEKQTELLRCAYREVDLLAVWTLLESGCSVAFLSKTEQKQLLRLPYHKGVNMFLQNICNASNLTQREILYVVNQLPKKEKEELLYQSCGEGNVLVVEALIAAGCSVNCVDLTGDTPLMKAAREGHEEVVRKLILEGANLAIQSDYGYTALHYAAICNHIQCGILLAEGGANLRTKNEFSETPLDVAKADFQEAIKQALSFITRKTLCIIGNAEGGKSTLIASLQAESSGFLGRIINSFRRVDDRRKRTAGIETVPHCSQRYGEVLFFDFAGQDDYHGPHQMFLESLLSKPRVSITLLLVVKMTEEEEAILHQLHRWLTPVALMATTDSPSHVIVIGSFLDKVKPKREATDKLIRCILATKRNLEGLPLRFVGTCFLNCRQPQSEGIKQLCALLQEVPIPEFRAAHTRYSLAWVLSQIRSSITVQAVQLQDFSAWLKGNEDNLPQTLPTPEEVCQDLSAAGHALYLPNKEDPNKSWLVLDLPSILHDVYGTLFSQSKEIANEFGLLHCHHLDRLFPDLDLAMVQQLLISLEFCIPVDPSILKVNLIELTQSEESSGWLFFPALISAKPQHASENLPEQNVHFLCWQLRISKKHSISAHILQTILLRLAAHFVVKQRDEEGVQQHCCSIWWNGIAWQSTVGVDVTVHVMNNRVIQVIAASTTADELCQYLTGVVSDVLSTVYRLSPKLEAAAYIVHPPQVATSPEAITAKRPKEFFPVEGIRDSIRDHREFVLSLKDSDKHSKRTSVADLFGGCTPSLKNIEKIIWPQPVANQPQLPTVPRQPDSQSVPSGAQALLDSLSTPDMRDVDELVVGDVAAHWQRLALRLGIKGCLSEIILKNHPSDCEGACRDLLDRWLRGERHTGEEERTWSTLLAALNRADFGELERRLRREHFKKK